MRLLVLGPAHPFRGGISATTTAAVQALRAARHEVTFITALRQYPRWLYPGAPDRDPAGAPPVPGSRADLTPLEPWRWLRMRRRARAVPADAWVLPYWTWAWAGWWRFLLAGGHPPAVAVVHNLVDHDGGALQRQAARAVLGRCDGLFTHAEAMAGELRRTWADRPVAAYPLPPPPVPPGSERMAARSALGLPTDGRLALFVGLVRPYKGVDLLVEAFRELARDTSWRLVVAGEPWGTCGRDLERQVTAAGLQDRVMLRLGWVCEADLSRYMAAADVVVLPYRSGSQSAVVPLALAHGRAVLSTRVGGIPEVIQDGISGRLVEPGSAAALARALRGLEPSEVERLETGARAAAARLTWGRYAASLSDLIERARARAGNSRAG